MSKHNNNLMPSSKARCKCGRYISIGEDIAGMGLFGYECPDCFHRKHSKPLSREDYYKQFGIITNESTNRLPEGNPPRPLQ